MTTTEPKKRGRPKKVVEAQKEENPDCKPATRGYVKCLLRKTMGHRHQNNMSLLGTFFGATVGWIVIILIVIQRVVIPEAWYASMFVGTIVCSLVFLDMVESDSSKTTESDCDDKIRSCIQKHTPPTPVCEKRKECE